MRSFILATALAAALVMQQVSAMILHVNDVSCQEMSVTLNATRRELEIIPAYAGVTVANQTQGVKMPASPPLPSATQNGNDMTMSFTFLFGEPFIVNDGMQNTTIKLTQYEDLSDALVTFQMSTVQFMGCSTTAEAANAPTVVQAAYSEANFNAAYEATATASATATATSTATGSSSTFPWSIPDDVPVTSATSTTSSGLGTAAKIGIAVGVLAAALLAVLATIGFLVRRQRHARDAQTGSEEDGYTGGKAKAQRHVSKKWVNDSQELKEMQSPEMR